MDKVITWSISLEGKLVVTDEASLARLQSLHQRVENNRRAKGYAIKDMVSLTTSMIRDVARFKLRTVAIEKIKMLGMLTIWATWPKIKNLDFEKIKGIDFDLTSDDTATIGIIQEFELPTLERINVWGRA